MKRFFLAVAVIVITAAFEQKAAMRYRIVEPEKPNTTEVVEQLDTLSKKFELFNKTHNNEK